MTNRGTPGPWTVGPHQRIISSGWSIRIADGSAIAYVLGEKNQELQQNAKILAASQEMLALCERALRALDEYSHPQLGQDLRDVIEKLTGEPQ